MSPSLTGTDVLLSLIGYIVVYLIIFPAGVLIMMRRIVRAGSGRRDGRSAPVESGTPGRSGRVVPLPRDSAMMPARLRAALDASSWASACSSMCCSTGSISASAFSIGFAPDRDARNLMMNSIAPIWDGNETWLVLGGVGLLAAFPLAFAIIIPAVYFPILVMLLALVFRGVAFEFRFRDVEHRTFWDHAFTYGSLVATFAQGIVLGAFIQGFEVEGPPVSPAARSIASRRSRFSPASRWCSATACWAPAG